MNCSWLQKGLILTLLLSIVLIGGCISYKNSSLNSGEKDLLKEIEALEEGLEIGLGAAESVAVLPAGSNPGEVVEEVVLPKLEEAPPSSVQIEQIIRIKEAETVTLKPKVLDPDNDKISLTYSRPLNENGEWKTDHGDAGEYVITVSASDGVTTVRKDVKIIVDKVNVAPVLEDITDLLVKEGELVTISPRVSDANGDKVTVSFSKPLEEGQLQTNFHSAGIYQITVTASDGELESQKTFTLTVDDVNQKPIISNLQDIQVKEGEILTLNPSVTDPDGDKVTITFSPPVREDGRWPLSYTDHGEYLVTITASDGLDTVEKQIKVSVEDVNAPVEFVDIVVEVN